MNNHILNFNLILHVSNIIIQPFQAHSTASALFITAIAFISTFSVSLTFRPSWQETQELLCSDFSHTSMIAFLLSYL